MPTNPESVTSSTKDEEKGYNAPQHIDTMLEEEKHEDLAAEFLKEHAEEASITPEEEKKLLWKIDWILMPTLCWTFCLQINDKNSYGSAALFGLPEATGLFRTINGVKDTGYYSIANSMFYIGYIPGALIFSYAAQRWPISKVMPTLTVVWGLAFLLTIVVENYQGMWTERFFLGFLEGGITPSMLLIVGQWYKKAEQPWRCAIWYSMTGGIVFIAWPIMAALMKRSAGMGFYQYKPLYELWGGLTILWGFMLYFIIPDSPATARFLTDRQRYVAIERLREDQSGIHSKFQMYQIKEGLLDIKLWLLFCISFCALTVNGFISAFGPLTIAALGFNKYDTIYLGLVTGAMSFLPVFFAGWGASYFKNARTIIMLISVVPPLISFVLLEKLPQSNVAGRLFATWFCVAYSGIYTVCMSLAVSNVAGYSKKVFASSFVFMGYSLGNIAGPLFFKAKDAPIYHSGFVGVLVCTCLGAGFILLYGYVCWADNRRRDKLGEVAQVDRAFQDLTDKENPTFRYNL